MADATMPSDKVVTPWTGFLVYSVASVTLIAAELGMAGGDATAQALGRELAARWVALSSVAKEQFEIRAKANHGAETLVLATRSRGDEDQQ